MHVVRKAFLPKALMVGAMLTFMVTSCKNGETEAEPSVPPSETFEMDYESFPSAEGGRAGREETEIAFGISAIAVGVWQTLVGLTMTIPVAAFKASVSQDPVYIEEEGRWHWNFTIGSSNTAIHSCNLYAQVDGQVVNWEMYLTREGDFSDFLWYTGTSRFDQTSGSWTVYRDPLGNSRAFLEIDWTRDTDAGTGTIRYTNIDAQDNNNGAYIESGRVESTSEFDTYYEITGADGATTLIEWHSSTHVGRLTNAQGATFCWDTNLQDVDCGN